MENETTNGEQEKQAKNGLAIILIVAGSILIIGNLYFYVAQKKRNNIKKQQLDSLTRQLDTANAKFEIGYGEMSIASYNKMKANAKEKDHGPLVYPVIKNEIDDLITTGAFHPDYGIGGAYLQEFTALYRKKKLKPFGTGVACLIIKQIGKGKAGTVKLDINRLKLDEISEMYDPTDINQFADYPESTGKPLHITSLQIDLGAMDTGSAWLVPLYISDVFLRLTEGGDPPGWSVTAGPILVPVNLSFAKKDKTIQKIPLKDVLSRPIEILD